MMSNEKLGNRWNMTLRETSQIFNPTLEHWFKRNTETSKVVDVKQDGTSFKGVRKEKN